MTDTYITIGKQQEPFLYKDKGSKFIAYCHSVKNQDEIKHTLQQIKDLHPTATHHCYAYRLGIQGKEYRANDDGEPNGSAGLPIYNQLLSSNISNVIVIVVRYYGGIKLGVSGLIKAYKTVTAEALKQISFIPKEITKTLTFTFAYENQKHISQLLQSFQSKIIGQQFDQFCTFTVVIKQSKYKELYKHLQLITIHTKKHE